MHYSKRICCNLGAMKIATTVNYNDLTALCFIDTYTRILLAVKPGKLCGLLRRTAKPDPTATDLCVETTKKPKTSENSLFIGRFFQETCFTKETYILQYSVS